jgi:tetratricopeptide (TPR) repeat protein
LSLDLAVRALESMEWKKLDLTRVRSMFSFLLVCEQPHRWKLLDEVADYLLAQKDLDRELRSQFHVAKMEALAGMGRAAEALKVGERALPEYVKTPALQVRLQLAAAAIHQYHYKDAPAASKIYKSILDEHSRTEHPNLRLAGIRWGDLFAEAGDLVRASETYRIAATLGGEKFAAGSVTDASTRGALLRIAEQKLQAGDITATRQLLEKIELEYPGRRLDGLYCFLRAESDRFAGRYEDALRHYEMIFKLAQWAGYRDRATYGIADTYRRLGELEKAQKWLGELKEHFAPFYESKKAGELDKQIGLRLERVKTAKTSSDPEDALFTEYHTGFEPGEPQWFGEPKDFAIVRGPGMFGPHAGLLTGPIDNVINLDYQRPIKNLTPGLTYWGEVWYRDLIKPPPPLAYQVPGMQMHLIGVKPFVTLHNDGVTIYRNNHHQWHKLSFKLVAPVEQADLILKLMPTNMTGHYLIDGLSLRPVTDRQLHALTRFREGAKTP